MRKPGKFPPGWDEDHVLGSISLGQARIAGASIAELDENVERLLTAQTMGEALG
jgi:hypothetical protein